MKCDRFVGTGIPSGNKIHKSKPVASDSGHPRLLKNCKTDTVDFSSNELALSNKIKGHTSCSKLSPSDQDMLIVIQIDTKPHTDKEHRSDEKETRISIREKRVYIYVYIYIYIYIYI